jgi:hypothetical protein
VKCGKCDQPMRVSTDDLDYTKLAGLRGKTVILVDVVFFHCDGCGPSARLFEIPRMAALHRELAAAKAIRVKTLVGRFTDADEWVFVLREREA